MKKGNRLQNGELAPDFKVKDVSDKRIELKAYQGRHLLLSFYRYASCPFCNLRIHELTQQQETWQKQGLGMVAVFQSPAQKIREYVGKELPFPVIADPARLLYKKYAVECSMLGVVRGMLFRSGRMGSAMRLGFKPGSIEGEMGRLPADFLIGPEQTIIEACYGRDIGDHLSIERITELFVH